MQRCLCLACPPNPFTTAPTHKHNISNDTGELERLEFHPTNIFHPIPARYSGPDPGGGLSTQFPSCAGLARPLPPQKPRVCLTKILRVFPDRRRPSGANARRARVALPSMGRHRMCLHFRMGVLAARVPGVPGPCAGQVCPPFVCIRRVCCVNALAILVVVLTNGWLSCRVHCASVLSKCVLDRLHHAYVLTKFVPKSLV